MKVLHLSTAHDVSDDRITVRQAFTLASSGYKVIVMAQRDEAHRLKQIPENLTLDSFPIWRSRIDRLFRGQFFALYKALRSGAKLVHLHDPELIPLGLLLKIFGKKIVIDLHEDLAKDIQGKYYLPSFLRKLLSRIIPPLLCASNRASDHFVAATESIAAPFPQSRVTVLRNFPRINEFDGVKRLNEQPTAVVTGAITSGRCLIEMLGATEQIENLQLLLAGPIPDKEDKEILFSHPLFGDRIRYLGMIPRLRVIEVLRGAWIGLCLYKPLPNHLEARPAKIYEYFASATPVLASNFPDWEVLMKSSGGGRVINPSNVSAIASTMREMIQNEVELRQQGIAARKAALSEYSWEAEALALTSLYKRILN